MSTVGVVVEFDVQRGIGTIETGGERHAFHAANLADGTRRVDVGARVTFRPLARFGVWEATAIQTLG